jgi:hypothetical protein
MWTPLGYVISSDSSEIQAMSTIRNRFTLGSSDFPREFAKFVNFLGGDELTNELLKVMRKLSGLRPNFRKLYGDRYFFHEQCLRFTDGPMAFHLEASNPVAIRAASLIAGINRISEGLSPGANDRFRKMCLAGLKPDRDVRQIEHEIRCFVHFGQKGFDVTFADLENEGRFDLLCKWPDAAFEVECKTVSEDTGSQIKSETRINLFKVFDDSIRQRQTVCNSGIFVFTLSNSAGHRKNLPDRLKDAIASSNCTCIDAADFSLTFIPRRNWIASANPDGRQKIRAMMNSDPELQSHAYLVTSVGNSIFAFVLRPCRSSTLSTRLVKVLKDAADQCSGSRPSLIWLHFVGQEEEGFVKLAEFSREGKGAGLNAIVAKTVHPEASPTDRCHVRGVRFSADPSGITTKPILDPSLLIVRAASVSGYCYDVPNPFCRFQTEIDF